MATLVLPFGSRIAADTHIPSEPCTLPSPRTVADLLAHWKLFPPTQHAMLRTTCARLADYFGESVETISIDRVDDGRKGFRAFLEGRKYGENSVRTYVNHLRILLASANAVGWSRGELVSDEWRMVIGLSEVRKCGRLARHLSTLRKNPRDVTFDDTDQWVQQAAQESISFAAATKMRSNFWRVLRDSGIAKLLPTYLLRENNYRISISDFPDDLEKEVTDLISWKQKPYAWDRPKGAHHRAPTAKRLVYVISQLYGFAINIASYNELTRLTDLVQRHIVGAFTEWCITERQVKGQTLQRNLRLLSAALHQHPNYKDLELDWFKPFLDGLPTDSTAVLNKKKAEKTLPYTVIEAIPEKIRAERRTASAHARRHLAVLVRNELMIRWLSCLPWRQRNIRECRIGGQSPNLYKGPVPNTSTIDMPAWALELRDKDPNTAFWQFHFTEEETKRGCTVDSLVPRQLFEPLEEYLGEFRADLVSGDDPGTLFLNEAGHPMSQKTVLDVVSMMTLRYGGRRVTPHLFRDIVALAWLKDHPKDYLTLSKLLWHSTPNEVIKTYGSLFNESSGLCMMEAWLEERAAKTKAS